MPNVKAQMSNQFQSLNNKIFCNENWHSGFDIHLAFAWLPQAGILTFGFLFLGR
jgi:hypothetical protein